MISASTSSSGNDTEGWLRRLTKQDIRGLLESVGQAGVNALASATPVGTGKTANSWAYKVKKVRGGWTLDWVNTNVNDGVVVAVIIQYGHGTGTGGYVPGVDYVNPAMAPIFENVIADLWREVTK
ncbi:hypothetical protein [uncultured Gordonia sp.]|jgi:hypothetical protein|uniref:hypothetical protein n=1 Tax=uncultured Gordonia sp. TaxID=198437 RepID=UPI00262CBD8C|nr:hypothetical protein [uncultured Gordonia sp.]